MNKTTENGFTLLELLITIVLFSIVVFSMLSSFNAFTLSSQKVKQEVESKEKITFVTQRIQKDLQALFVIQPPQYKPPEFNSEPDPYRMVGVQENISQKTVSSLYFSSLAHLDIAGESRSGVARLTYYLKPNDQETLDLYRHDSLWPFSEEMPTCRNPVLFKGLSGFDIVYIDREGEEHTSWDSESEDTGFSFPQRLQFVFTTGSRENSKKFSISVEVPCGRAAVEE